MRAESEKIEPKYITKKYGHVIKEAKVSRGPYIK
jgi:hypothetical protein